MKEVFTYFLTGALVWLSLIILLCVIAEGVTHFQGISHF